MWENPGEINVEEKSVSRIQEVGRRVKENVEQVIVGSERGELMDANPPESSV